MMYSTSAVLAGLTPEVYFYGLHFIEVSLLHHVGCHKVTLAMVPVWSWGLGCRFKDDQLLCRVMGYKHDNSMGIMLYVR